MRRRNFIKGIIGSAAAWPLAAHAQRPDRVRRIGVLMGLAASDPDAPRWASAFQQALQDSGWTEGRDIKIEYRWGSGDARVIRTYAAELIGLAPEVIVTRGSTALRTLQQETNSIPLVFVTVSRSSRQRIRGQLGKTGRQYYGVYAIRIYYGRKVARNSQRDCANYYSCRSNPKSCKHHEYRTDSVA
jgi:putative tryptophan/tyrosine transport system substrate-binding protein